MKKPPQIKTINYTAQNKIKLGKTVVHSTETN